MTAPVVLVPGLQSTGNSWMPLLKNLCNTHAISVPMGHQFDTTITKMAQRVLDQSAAEFHLVGWSMGGYIALEMLRLAPNRLRSLTLISTTAAPESPASLTGRAEALNRARQHGIRAYQTFSMNRSIYDMHKMDPVRIDAMRDASQTLGVAALQAQTDAIIARADSRPVLAQSTLPVMIIAGTQDQVIPVQNAHEMSRLRPDARYHELSDCGHCPPLEMPDHVASLMRSWLNSLTHQPDHAENHNT